MLFAVGRATALNRRDGKPNRETGEIRVYRTLTISDGEDQCEIDVPTDVYSRLGADGQAALNQMRETGFAPMVQCQFRIFPSGTWGDGRAKKESLSALHIAFVDQPVAAPAAVEPSNGNDTTKTNGTKAGVA